MNANVTIEEAQTILRVRDKWRRHAAILAKTPGIDREKWRAQLPRLRESVAYWMRMVLEMKAGGGGGG